MHLTFPHATQTITIDLSLEATHPMTVSVDGVHVGTAEWEGSCVGNVVGELGDMPEALFEAIDAQVGEALAGMSCEGFMATFRRTDAGWREVA